MQILSHMAVEVSDEKSLFCFDFDFIECQGLVPPHKGQGVRELTGGKVASSGPSLSKLE